MDIITATLRCLECEFEYPPDDNTSNFQCPRCGAKDRSLPIREFYIPTKKVRYTGNRFLWFEKVELLTLEGQDILLEIEDIISDVMLDRVTKLNEDYIKAVGKQVKKIVDDLQKEYDSAVEDLLKKYGIIMKI